MDGNSSLNEDVGRKMIETAAEIDESVSELLKIEVKRLKQALKSGTSTDELRHAGYLIKYFIMILTLSEEKMRAGIELCCSSKCETVTPGKPNA